MITRVEVEGVEIAYDVVGHGPAVLLIHGFTGDRSTMAELAHGLAVDHTVVSVDLIGHGDSDSPANPDAYSMTAAARQLAAVADQVGGAVDVIGYSLGGRVALSFGVQRPELVRTLTLIGGSPGLTGDARIERARADEALADDIEARGLEAFVDRWMALPMWRSLERRWGPDRWATSRRQRMSGSTVGFANSLRGMGTGVMTPLCDELPALERPVHLVVGQEDVKFVAIARDMASRLSDATVTTIAHAGHAAHLEQPTTTLAAVRAWLP